MAWPFGAQGACALVWDFKTGSDLDGTVSVNDDGHLFVAVEKQHIPGPGGVFRLDSTKPPAKAVVWYCPTKNRVIAEWLGGVVGSVALDDTTDRLRTRPRIAAFNSVNGYLYVVSQDVMDGVTTGPDNKTAFPRPTLIHRHHTGGAISPPVIVGDSIVVAGYDGRVRVLRVIAEPTSEGQEGKGVLLLGRDGQWYLTRVEEVASSLGGGSFESTPLVWEGRIYIGSRDGYLHCLGSES